MSSDSEAPHEKALPKILGSERPGEHDGETITSNRVGGNALLSICIPSYHDNASPLIEALAKLEGTQHCTLLLYDDGSGDDALIAAHKEAVLAYPGPARFICADKNFGRSHARNRLVARAEADWILLLDADMLPDDVQFLESYIEALKSAGEPALIAGGFSLKQLVPKKGHRLHEAQAALSDCVDAATRSGEPGRYVFTSNILVHKDVLSSIPFDEAFSGWGWEDVDWGLRVAGRFPILHIENTATHMGMDADADLIKKFGNSGQNFARLVEKHPAETAHMPLTRASRKLKGVPVLGKVGKILASAEFIPLSIRTRALKIYRAAAYSEFIDAK